MGILQSVAMEAVAAEILQLIDNKLEENKRQPSVVAVLQELRRDVNDIKEAAKYE